MSSFKELRPACPRCGGECAYTFTPTITQFALKDGPSGSWPSKGNNFQAYRARRSDEMKRRQRDRYGEPKKLIPNYKGQETGSWREAQSLAMSDKESHERRGVDSIAVGSTFNAKIAEEGKK